MFEHIKRKIGTFALGRIHFYFKVRIFCSGFKVFIKLTFICSKNPRLSHSFIYFATCLICALERTIPPLRGLSPRGCNGFCVCLGEVLEQADYLYSCAETEKLYQLLVQYKDSNDAEFLWRLARASRDLSLLPNIEAGRKKQLTFEAFEYAKKALEKDDLCSAAHKWYGVCLSDVGDYEGVKVKIGNSYIIRDHLERAIELNPKDATSIHILGYWCFAFAELPWYQRKVAAVIFSSPPESTYEEALAFFLKAEEVDPNFYSKNLLMLGKTYLAMKDKEKALLWLTKTKEYPAHTLEDKEVHKEAVDLLKKLG
uniref:Regulator of microtubule dynamics protein 1 n=1 Tax=Astatotilapia calliptera TaxID=8154 RepID=A0A3P8PPP7_ASTCA